MRCREYCDLRQDARDYRSPGAPMTTHRSAYKRFVCGGFVGPERLGSAGFMLCDCPVGGADSLATSRPGRSSQTAHPTRWPTRIPTSSKVGCLSFIVPVEPRASPARLCTVSVTFRHSHLAAHRASNLNHGTQRVISVRNEIRFPVTFGQIIYPPFLEGQQYRSQRAAFVSEVILRPRRMLRVRASFDHTVSRQRLQSRAQHIARSPRPSGDPGKPAIVKHKLTHHQKGPTLADHFQCVSYRANTHARIGLGHTVTLPS